MDGDGLATCAESANGSDPLNPDSNGDGLLDGAGVKSGNSPRAGKAPPPVPGDVTPPTITLTEPTNAVLISSVP